MKTFVDNLFQETESEITPVENSAFLTKKTRSRAFSFSRTSSRLAFILITLKFSIKPFKYTNYSNIAYKHDKVGLVQEVPSQPFTPFIHTKPNKQKSY